ncbi:MAG: repressor LexA [Pseudohongiellaceae bacterium]
MFLTEKQQAVFAFIRDFIEDKGYSPTLEEMSQYFGVSKVTIYEHVKALQEKGAVKKQANRKRSIELVSQELAPTQSTRRHTLPIMGRVAAGDFIEAVQSTEEFSLDDMTPRMDDCYMLRVQGNSMIEDHICPGDLVIVQPADTAQNNDIVVAMVDDEDTGNKKATIKRFFHEGDHIRLQPANSELSPILVKEVEIQGRVIGVVRATI